MIEIDDKIVSADLLRECFACDLTQCKGICCVEGNAGAPLEMDEVDVLEEEWENYRPYMTPEGIEAVERQGFMVVDPDGDYTTPLVDDAECAFSCEENGIIRLASFSNGSIGLNYHRWEVCRPACECGKRLGIPVYRALKEPIVRRFGEDFYHQLEAAADLLAESE